MAVPLTYNLRNVRVRWRVSVLAVVGVALVVGAFAVLMSMSRGFASALRATGRPDNAMVVGQGTSSEATSFLSVEERGAILTHDRILRGADGRPLVSWETVSIVPLPRRSDGRRTNVTLRGGTPLAYEVRTGITLTAGRRFTAGLAEVIVGRRSMQRVRGLELDGTLRLRGRLLKVVGVFTSEGAAFESEIWGDYDVITPLVRRRTGGASALVARVSGPRDIAVLDRWLRVQPQMALRAVSERTYYEDQAGPLSRTITLLAGLVAVVMGVGAAFGAMNTMYGIVAARTREIGTLRAIGFSRRAILGSFVLESALLALLGG